MRASHTGTQRIRAVDLFIGFVGTVVGVVAEFGAFDALGSSSWRSFGTQELIIGTSALCAVLLVPTVGAV